jgi:hypothetical protein
MRRVSVTFLLLLLHAHGQAKQFTCDTLDVNHTNPPQCTLPHLDISQARTGYVSATGTWSPDGFLDKADVEFTCVRASVPQLSDSKVGYCLMASAVIVSGIPAVSTTYFDVTSWENAKIIAERPEGWQVLECESQVIVMDFRFNTITLTSTLNRSGARCRQRFETIEKLTKKPMKDSEVFSLVHSYGSLYVEGDHIKTFNPFFKP